MSQEGLDSGKHFVDLIQWLIVHLVAAYADAPSQSLDASGPRGGRNQLPNSR